MRFITAVVCLALTGCMSAAMKRPYASISSSATSAATDTKSAYAAAEDAYNGEQTDELVQRYKDRGYTPGEITAFLSSKDMKSRMEAVDVISQYGSQINSILNPKFTTTTQSKQSTASASKSSTKTASSPFPKLTQSEINIAQQAITYIGEALASVKTRRQLPKAVAKADPSIQILCDLFTKDMDTLRSEIKESYNTRLILENEFIQNNLGKMDAVEQRAEIVKLPALEKQARDADDALGKAQDELKRMAEQSRKLAEAYHGKK